MGSEMGSSPSRRIGGIFRPASGCASLSWRRSATRLPGVLTDSDGTASGSCSETATSGNTGRSLAIGKGKTLALGLRRTRFLALFALTATLVLRLTRSFAFFAGLRLAPLALVVLGLRRGVFGLLRVTRRRVRAADITAFPERGFFVLIPDYDPFGGCRILSDVLHFTAAAQVAQRVFAQAAQSARSVKRSAVGAHWERMRFHLNRGHTRAVKSRYGLGRDTILLPKSLRKWKVGLTRFDGHPGGQCAKTERIDRKS